MSENALFYWDYGLFKRKRWDISKMPFARRKGSAERPCCVLVFNRFLLYPP